MPILPWDSPINNFIIICFDQASQNPVSLYFASLSWHPKPAGTPSFAKTSQMSVGFFLLILCVNFNDFSWDISSQLLKNGNHFLSKASTSTSLKMSTVSKHYCLEYCAFNHNWRSILTNDRRVLTCFVTDSSACNLGKDSFNLCVSTSTYLSTSSSLL